uniref:Thyroglobulin-like isoform X1 n=2 Tax=Diabrotica virgifera virgifera TaxID=50390 RepID=A0A6P7H4E1_DIAVI
MTVIFYKKIVTTMLLFAILFCIFGPILAGEDNILCTEETCKDIKCDELPPKCQIQNATHNGLILPSMMTCNCCEYCLENLNEGEECSMGDISNPDVTEICGAGLYCKNTTPGESDGICSRMETSCTKKQDDYDGKRENGTLGYMEVRQDCDSEGEFVPYKCIPGETCYCVDSTGNRIFGEADFTSIPESELKCKCSRDYEEAVVIIGRELNPGEIFKCSPNGDYYPVQCMDEKCFCVDTYDGVPTYPDAKEVNITDISKDTLKCYKNKEPGIFYEKCESEYLESYKAYKALKDEGFSIMLGFTFPNCDIDGTYKSVQENSTHKYCVDKEGSILNAVLQTDSLAKTMDCKCARARLTMSSNEKPSCDANGNYSQKQCRRGKCRCVDSDGNQVCKKAPCEVDQNKDKLTCPK